MSCFVENNIIITATTYTIPESSWQQKNDFNAFPVFRWFKSGGNILSTSTIYMFELSLWSVKCLVKHPICRITFIYWKSMKGILINKITISASNRYFLTFLYTQYTMNAISKTRDVFSAAHGFTSVLLAGACIVPLFCFRNIFFLMSFGVYHWHRLASHMAVERKHQRWTTSNEDITILTSRLAMISKCYIKSHYCWWLLIQEKVLKIMHTSIKMAY